MESKYMRLKKWKYKQPLVELSSTINSSSQEPSEAGARGGFAHEPKGFVSRLITNVKGDQVKQLQEAGKKRHGITISISRPRDTITRENKWKKRKKGTFHVTKLETSPRKRPRPLYETTEDDDDRPILDQLSPGKSPRLLSETKADDEDQPVLNQLLEVTLNLFALYIILFWLLFNCTYSFVVINVHFNLKFVEHRGPMFHRS